MDTSPNCLYFGHPHKAIFASIRLITCVLHDGAHNRLYESDPSWRMRKSNAGTGLVSRWESEIDSGRIIAKLSGPLNRSRSRKGVRAPSMVIRECVRKFSLSHKQSGWRKTALGGSNR